MQNLFLSKTNVMVEFKIIGDEFEEQVINQKLSLKPNEYWKKGSIIEKHNILRTYTCWILSTGYEESLDINIQLTKLIDELSVKVDILSELRQQLDINYMIDIVVNIENNEKPAIYLNWKSIEFMHNIHSEIDIDLYVFS